MIIVQRTCCFSHSFGPLRCCEALSSLECRMLYYPHQILQLSSPLKRQCVDLREMLADAGSHPETLGEFNTKNKLENIQCSQFHKPNGGMTS